MESTAQLQIDRDVLRQSGVSRLDDYLGYWAMEERKFLAGYQQICRMDLQLHIAQAKASTPADGSSRYQTFITGEGIAVVQVLGSLMKAESSMDSSSSTVRLRQSIRSLARDPNVKGIMLLVDSPGGTVSGTSDFADEVAAAAVIKPVSGYAEDLAASAAYWILSQTQEISAGKTSLVGSIGTYGVVVDYSGQAAKEGIVVHVIRAGEFKGSGVPGTPVTKEQLTEMQRIVDSLNENFLSGVSKGRGMSLAQVKKVADGRVHKAPDALKLGIVDHVESFDAAIKRLEQRISGGTKQTPAGGRAAGIDKRKDTAMSEAATVAELKAAFPNHSDFVLQQLEKGHSLIEAKGDFSDVLAAENAELRKNAKRTGVGVEGLGAGAPSRAGLGGLARGANLSSGGNADLFNELVAQIMETNGGDRRKAMVAAAKQNPALHQAYIDETNNDPRTQRFISEMNKSPRAGRG